MASNFPGLKDPRDLSRFGRLAAARRMAEDDYAAILANRTALRRAIQGEPEPAMSRVPSPAEFKLTSDIQKANAEPRPTSAFDVLRRELPRFFHENDELADRVGDFSLKQGALATLGGIGGVALPATLPASLPLAARIAGGIGLSNAGDALMSPGAEKVLGTDVMDPIASSLFGGVLGAKGKVLPALAAAVAGSTGDAQGAGFLRRLVDLPGPAHTARRYTPDERVAMLNELAPYARAKALEPKASNILSSVLDDAVRQNETTVLYDQFNKPISMYSMAGRGEPFDDSEYLSGLVSLNGPQGTGRQAAQHAARNSPLEGFRLFSTPTSKGFWDRIVETEPDWGLQYMPEHGLSAYRYLPPIKFAGGGSVAGAAKRLAQRAMSQADDLGGAVVAPRGALSVVKNKGGNWLTGSVEDSLGGLKRRVPSVSRQDLMEELTGYKPGSVSAHRVQTELDQLAGPEALNSFIDKQLTRYIKNEMATPEDPIRALAERGVLHFDPATVSESRLLVHPSGEEVRKVGQSEAAQGWENLSDRFVYPNLAGNISIAKTLKENPWLDKLKVSAPDTPVYSRASLVNTNDLGFDHLIDELSNALNPESGLPRHLLLDPKSMSRVSVPQAVERVSAINAWRAAQKAEADALRANNAATQVYKEYPENNPLGLRWVELRAPTPPEGWVQEGAAWRHPDAWKKEVAKEHPWLYPNDMLQDALKYEGDMMGHCVGGYCDDVLEGRSRIYSLRDAKGQPHVTVEVAPDSDWKNKLFEASRRGNSIEEMFGERAGEIREAFYASPFNNIQQFLEKNPQYLPQERRIVQIKGKQNRAPNPEYLPFVQDFVKSGQWSDVGDLQNTGLIRHTGERAKNLGEYSTEQELNDYLDKFMPEKKAQGGLVEDMIEQNLDALVEKQTPKQMSRGGSVRTPIRAKIEKMTSELRQCRN